MPKKLYTGIVFFENGENPRKYRNISNLGSFMRFLGGINAYYVNIYDKATKSFIERIYIKKGGN